MVDLRVDSATLDRLHESLEQLAERFERIRADSEVTGRGWGGSHVRKSMDEFVDNWEVHREKVGAAVRELAEDCKVAAGAFKAVEHILGQALPVGAEPAR